MLLSYPHQVVNLVCVCGGGGGAGGRGKEFAMSPFSNHMSQLVLTSSYSHDVTHDKQADEIKRDSF